MLRFKFNIILALSLGVLLLSASYLFYQAAGFPFPASAEPFVEPTGSSMEHTPTSEEEITEDKTVPAITREIPLPPPPRTATVIAVGDIMVHQTQFVQAYDANKNRYDFSPSFESITPYLQSSDLAVGNLETTLAGPERGFSAFPRFNSPDEIATALRGAGFDLLCTANNHSMDSGQKGVSRTLEIIEGAGMKAFGTARSQDERDTPLLVEENGINLAFLAYTYGTNGIPLPAGREYMVNLINKDLMHYHIQQAYQAGADLIIVYMHWGWEYRSEPSPEQKELAHFLAEAGAHIIIGSHPHVIQPMEYINTEDEHGNKHRAFVAYSLGNFISNQHRIPGAIPTHEVEYGMLLRLHLKKDTPDQAAYLDNVDYKLTWVDRAGRHRIIPLPPVTEDLPRPPFIPEGKWPEIRETTIMLQERLSRFSPGEFALPHQELDKPAPDI